MAVEEAWRDSSMRLDFCHQPQVLLSGPSSPGAELAASSEGDISVVPEVAASYNQLKLLTLF
ncbi:TPA: hypothetical protein R2K55_004214 [Raoultella ornithinolytica]|nr:hypothetical protein [Raoultella ornithinolytica]HEC2605239.1 hypothetical protein [Raoultella ornithinolytica]HEC2611336.1 hypothetical protein [Raoultella ornithinolytica]